MKSLPAMVVGFLIVALLVGEIAYELKTGKLLARSWRVFAKRRDNPMLFWSTMTLQILVAFVVIGVVVLAVVGLRK